MKNPVKKLFAIAFVMSASTASADVPRTLANGAPACGNTGGKGKSSSMCGSAETALNLARRALAYALDEERHAVAALLTKPRVLASGAPACGNTGGKSDDSMNCTTASADRQYDQRVRRLVVAGEHIRIARGELAATEDKYAKYTSMAYKGAVASYVAPSSLGVDVGTDDE